MKKSTEIKIYGVLGSATSDGVLALANHILDNDYLLDGTSGALQSAINSSLNSKVTKLTSDMSTNVTNLRNSLTVGLSTTTNSVTLGGSDIFIFGKDFINSLDKETNKYAIVLADSVNKRIDDGVKTIKFDPTANGGKKITFGGNNAFNGGTAKSASLASGTGLDLVKAGSGYDYKFDVTVTVNGKSINDLTNAITVSAEDIKLGTSALGKLTDKESFTDGTATIIDAFDVLNDKVDGTIKSLGDITRLGVKVVTALPKAAQAEIGTIYLIKHTHNDSTATGSSDSYDEYIFIKSGSDSNGNQAGTFEKIGNTDVNLNNYITKNTFATLQTSVSSNINDIAQLTSTIGDILSDLQNRALSGGGTSIKDKSIIFSYTDGSSAEMPIGHSFECNNSNVYYAFNRAVVTTPAINKQSILDYIDGNTQDILPIQSDGVYVAYVDDSEIPASKYTGGTYTLNTSVNSIRIKIGDKNIDILPTLYTSADGWTWSPESPNGYIDGVDNVLDGLGSRDTRNMNDNNGRENTKAIVKRCGSLANYAAAVASTQTFRNGKSGYLPAIDELALLTNFAKDFNDINQKLTGNTSAEAIGNSYYGGDQNGTAFWSSTQYGTSYAWFLNNNGYADYNNWYGNYSVLIFLAS